MDNIINLIDDKFEELTSSQKKAAIYIRNNSRELAFSNVKKTAEKSGVSEATIVRLSRKLGFDGYTHFQKKMQSFVLEKRTTTRLNEFITEDNRNGSWLEKHFSQEMQNLNSTLEYSQEKSINICAGKILSSDKIYITGWRAELALSSPLSYILNYTLGNTHMVEHYEAAEILSKTGTNDLFFVCGFPRYSKHSLKIASRAKSYGAFVITLTDSELSPFVRYADISLFTSINSKGFLDSYTAALSLTNALIKEIAFLAPERVYKNLERIEENFKYFDEAYKWEDQI